MAGRSQLIGQLARMWVWHAAPAILAGIEGINPAVA